MAEIVLEHLSKTYPGGVVGVDDVSLNIGDGEFIVLVGPSGCGKSTLLRLIAGLEEASQGTIAIGGEDVTTLAPRRRDIAMVFQSYALYPHMSVRQNIAYGLKVRRTPKEETKRRVEDVAGLLGLEALLDRRPAQLSGGQRQRVAIARALVGEPSLLLADEPTGNLDSATGDEIVRLFAELHGRGHTIVLVTHEPRLAARCPRAVRLSDGRVVADGPGREVAALGAPRAVSA
jgi:ABC-type sugar transport system ATPase subunit